MEKSDILDCHKEEEVEKQLPKYIDRLIAPQEELKAIRQERLRKILSFAKKNSPWYQKSLAHIDVDNMTEERLQDLPILTKEMLMNNWDEIVTDKRINLRKAEAHLAKMHNNPNKLYLDESFHVLATSGSSGTRGVFVFNTEEWLERYISRIRYSRFVKNKNGIVYNAKKMKLAQVIMESPVYAAYAFARTFQDDSLERYFFSMNMPLDKIVAELNMIQPDILSGVPSSLFYLCREAEKGKLMIQPSKVTATAEALYPPIRALIKKTWPTTQVFNYYGATEGIKGFNCRPDNLEMHLDSDYCIVEPCDERNAPVGLEKTSDKILLTNLFNYTQPLIRYEITDRIKFLDKTCQCGLAHQLIAEPEGRPEFDFFYPNNVFVHHIVFVTALLLEKAIGEYQVKQTLLGADIEIVSRGFINTFFLKRRIIQKLKELGLKNPKVTITIVPVLTYPASGKLRRFLPLDKQIVESPTFELG